MAHTVLLVIVFAALSSGARYVDYSGARMPEYSADIADYQHTRDASANPPDLYRDLSPDAPAPLDYKYEEESFDQSVTPRSDDSIEVETAGSPNLQKSQRKQKRPPLSSDDADVRAQKNIPKFKSNDPYRIHRPRNNNKNFDREMTFKKHAQYLRNKDRSDLDNENNFHIMNQDDRLERKSIDFEGSKNSFNSKSTSERARKARRKPRDRYVKSPQEEDVMENDDDMLVGRLEKEGRIDKDYSESYEGSRKIAGDLDKEDKSDIEYPIGNERRRMMTEDKGSKSGIQFQAGNKGRRLRPVVDRSSSQQYVPGLDYLEDTTFKLSKLEHKKSDKYDDYYYDMKRIFNVKKKLPNLLRQQTIAMKLVPEPETAGVPHEWPHRRADIVLPVLPIPKRPTTTSTSMTAVTTTLVTTTPETTQTSTIARKDLSLQEKSRLSILKKAQRKENMFNETSTKKPPVLLQVATKMQTVIMVEPPSSQGAYLRAREVSGDTSGRLDQVKRMMRHKLVANAQSIRDLTDNWDDLVCDYIDVSLLDNSATAKSLRVLTSVCFTVFFVLIQ